MSAVAELWRLHDKVMSRDQDGCWQCGEQEYSPALAMIDGALRLICEACANEMLEP